MKIFRQYCQKINAPKNSFYKLVYLISGIMLILIGITGLIIPILPGFLAIIPGFYLTTLSSKRIKNRVIRVKFLKKLLAENET
ncbi:MAG: hypothetical protein Q8903_03770 [Bacteroidota bacterium]|nr:hypothetical protein [Bacteroidota bacterium]